MQALFNLKKNFGFSVFGYEHEMQNESAKRRWIHCAKMNVNLQTIKLCLCVEQTRAPWGDTSRLAGMSGRAKESGFRINAHKVGGVVNSRGGFVCLSAVGAGERHHARIWPITHHRWHGRTSSRGNLSNYSSSLAWAHTHA